MHKRLEKYLYHTFSTLLKKEQHIYNQKLEARDSKESKKRQRDIVNNILDLDHRDLGSNPSI